MAGALESHVPICVFFTASNYYLSGTPTIVMTVVRTKTWHYARTVQVRVGHRVSCYRSQEKARFRLKWNGRSLVLRLTVKKASTLHLH